MKRILFVLFLLFVFVALASAQKTSITVGGSYWGCSYDKIASNSDYEDMEMGSGSIFGPYLSINSNRWNFGMNYLFGKFEPDFEEFGLTDYAVSRSDINFTLGYRVIAQRSLSMNLFGGVKLLKITEEATAQWYGDYYSYEAEYKGITSGPMFGGGVSTVVPFGSSDFYLYGSLAYLTGTMTYKVEMDGEELGSEEADNATNLIALTAGLGYRFPGDVGISGGYRGDFFGSEDSDYVDRLSGFIVSVSYTIK
jgi:hypothetical protein